jgi:hypothetical protein
MKRRSLMRHLQAAGCIVLREGSNHTIVFNPANNRQSSVPRHGEIDAYLARAICRHPGIASPPER